jgi:hypothetical protein
VLDHRDEALRTITDVAEKFPERSMNVDSFVTPGFLPNPNYAERNTFIN